MSKSQSLIFQSSPTCPGEGAAVFPWWFWPFLALPEHVGKNPPRVALFPCQLQESFGKRVISSVLKTSMLLINQQSFDDVASHVDKLSLFLSVISSFRSFIGPEELHFKVFKPF